MKRTSIRARKTPNNREGKKIKVDKLNNGSQFSPTKVQTPKKHNYRFGHFLFLN